MTAPAPPRSSSSSSQAQAAQAAQAGLAVIVAQTLANALPTVDLGDPVTIRRFTVMARAVVAKFAPASATLAARSYMRTRREAGVTRPYRVSAAAPPAADDVQAAVEWAVRNQFVPAPDMASFDADMTSSVQKLVQDTGRRTVIENVRRDPAASAWARVTEPGACSFCIMLAARGAVYKADTVDFKAHVRHDGSGGDCRCHAVPVFGRYEPTAQVREWQDLWQKVVTDQGRTGADARAAFRQAVEDRPVTGLTRGPNAPRKTDRTKAPTTRPSPPATPEEAYRLIRLFEQSNARASGNPKLAAMVTANNTRISELRSFIAQPL